MNNVLKVHIKVTFSVLVGTLCVQLYSVIHSLKSNVAEQNAVIKLVIFFSDTCLVYSGFLINIR